MAAVEFKHVDVIFGKQQTQACELLDQGVDRSGILKRTGSVLGVADASLKVEAGEICVLMGLSGSGKSSLLRCVNGLNKVTRGELLVEHKGSMVDLARISAKQLRELRKHRIAMVFQQFGLLPWSTVRENVAFGLEIKGESKAKIQRIVDEKLALVSLTDWADKQVHELSGGMQQRVGLARAFATDADILLMDEPFSALDPLIREHLQDELLELQKTLRRTIIFVSHDLNEALKLGNQIAIMDGGRIIQAGTARDIIFNPANEYVRRFVANINPLHVLYAGAVMRSLDELEREENFVRLSAVLSVQLDVDGRPERLLEHGQPLLVGMDGLCIDHAAAMREVVQRMQRGQEMPLLVTEKERLVGVIGVSDILQSLLRQV